jgi:hypothetical protein
MAACTKKYDSLFGLLLQAEISQSIKVWHRKNDKFKLQHNWKGRKTNFIIFLHKHRWERVPIRPWKISIRKWKSTHLKNALGEQLTEQKKKNRF